MVPSAGITRIRFIGHLHSTAYKKISQPGFSKPPKELLNCLTLTYYNCNSHKFKIMVLWRCGYSGVRSFWQLKAVANDNPKINITLQVGTAADVFFGNIKNSG